jgi:GTP-binding protein
MDQSFVMADIPGLIEGAADGAGLGIQFLKHLERTRLLLHLVDVGTRMSGGDPVADLRAVETELSRYSDHLAAQPRWLVINKVDLLPPEDRDRVVAEMIKELNWQAPWFAISAISGEGTQQIAQRAMQYLRETKEGAEEPEL